MSEKAKHDVRVTLPEPTGSALTPSEWHEFWQTVVNNMKPVNRYGEVPFDQREPEAWIVERLLIEHHRGRQLGIQEHRRFLESTLTYQKKKPTIAASKPVASRRSRR